MYHAPDMSDIKRRYAQATGNKEAAAESREKLPYYQLKKGRNQVRILPAYDEKGRISREVSWHWDFTAEKGSSKLCLGKKTFPEAGLSCPLCKAVWDSPLADKKGYFPSTKHEVNAIVRSEGEGVKLIRLPVKVMEAIWGMMADPMIGDITHPEKGYDLVITREGEKLTTSYFAQVIPSTYGPIFPDQAKNAEVLTKLHNLEAIYKLPDDAAMVQYKELATKWANHFIGIAEKAKNVAPQIGGLGGSDLQREINNLAQRIATPAVPPPPVGAPTAPANVTPIATAAPVPPGAPPCFGQHKHISSTGRCVMCAQEPSCKRI